jgi:MFS family permease
MIPDASDAPARTAARLLLDPRFGPHFVGKILSTVGVWVHNVSAAVLVHDLTGSSLLVGAVSVGQFLPQLLLTTWTGARADRADRRRQVMLGVGVTSLGSLALAAWASTVGLPGRTGATAVIAAATIVGIGFAIGGPAMQALIPALVRPNELTRAVALTTLPMTIARAAGPAIGAVLVTRGTPVLAFATAGTLHLLYLATLTRLPAPRPHGGSRHEVHLLDGWRTVRATPHLAALLVGVAVVGVGVDPVITLTPAIAAALGAGPTLVGSLASAFGVGAAVGLGLLGPVRRRFGLEGAGTAGLVVLGTGMAAVAVAPGSAMALAALVVAGTGMTLALTSFTTALQHHVEDRMRGRVMAVWAVAFLGSRPLTAAVSGAVTDATSVHVALLLAAIAIAIGAWATRPARSRVPVALGAATA